jgi:N-acetylmuramoyl-L-alanine amidase
MKNLLKVILVMSVPLFLSFKGLEPIEKKMRVVIDAGHGGSDNGVVVDDIMEKEITAAISRKVKFLNRNKSVEIIILRNSDKFISLSDRVEKINELKPDMVISLHANFDQDSTINGFEVFVGEKNVENSNSKDIAESMYNSTPKSLSKREVKETNLYILNNVECPAVLLEVGFLSNPQDREYLTSQLGQQRIAEMILKNIEKK